MTRGTSGGALPASWLGTLGLVVLTAAVYAPVRGFGFIYLDDDRYVFENPVVQSGLTLSGLRWAFEGFHLFNWHPLTWLSHMLDWQLFGAWPGGHHLSGLALHLVATALLHRALVALTGAPGRSLFVAAIFALHPQHLESVAWVSGRKDVLAAVFGFASLWAYARYAAAPSARRLAWVALALAASLLAKPLFVTWPAVLLLLDVWPLRRFGTEGTWRLLREKLPLLALSAVSAVTTLLAQHGEGAVLSLAETGPGFRLLKVASAYIAYLRAAFWPAELSIYTPLAGVHVGGVAGIASAVFVAGASALALLALRRWPPVGVGWLWWVGMLVPMAGFVQVGGQFVADRYSYVPMVGLSIAVAWGGEAALARLRAPVAARAALAAGLVLACAVATQRQLPHWRDTASIFGAALAVDPDNAFAHLSLGRGYDVAGDLDLAERHYRRALELRSPDPLAENGLGNVLLKRGDVGRAVFHYRRAVEQAPAMAAARANLGIALARQGRHAEAEAELREALRLDPASAPARAELERLRRRDALSRDQAGDSR